MWRLCTSSTCGMFADTPVCDRPTMKQFGKPFVCMPNIVETPSFHF